MAEVFLVRKINIALPDLYMRNNSVYWYWKGVNPRAVAALILGVVPTLPGFIRNINPKLGIPVGSTYVTAVVYPVGALTAGLSFWLLSTIFPPVPLPTSYSTVSYTGSIDEEDTKEKDLATSSIVAV